MASLRQFLARLAQRIQRELGARQRDAQPLNHVSIGLFTCARCRRTFSTRAAFGEHVCLN